MVDSPGPYPDTPSRSDYYKDAAETAAGLVPILGPSMARIVGHAWTSHLEQRQVKWHNDVNEILASFAERIEGLEEKLQSDEFLTLYIRASQAASETHLAETRNALRNAVLNAALEREDEDWSYVFIDLVSRLRPAHLQLLAFAAQPIDFLPRDSSTRMSLTMRQVAAKAFPEWSKAYFDEIKFVLTSEGLVELPDAMMTASGVMEPRITEKGTRFLSFISEPDPS